MIDTAPVVVQAEKKSSLVSKAFNVNDLSEKILKLCCVTAKKVLYEYQVEPALAIIKALLTDSAVITILIARQSGKTTLMETLVPGLMIILPRLAAFYPKELGKYRNGFWVGLFSASDEQIFTMFSRVKIILEEDGQDVIEDQDIQEEVRGRTKSVLLAHCKSVVRMQSADARSKIESKTYHLIINDEAHLTDSRVYEEKISPMGTATDATEVKLGVGHIQRNHFWKSIQNNKRLRASGRKPQYHFEYDDDEVIRLRRKAFKLDQDPIHLFYEKYIARKRKELTVNSIAYRVAYKLHFPVSHGMFTTIEQIKSLGNKRLHWQSSSKKICVAGIDLAKEVNNTVLTIMELDFTEDNNIPTKTILDIEELEYMKYEEQYTVVINKLLQYDVKVFAIDTTGVGNPIFERFEKLLEDYDEIKLEKCVYSTSSKHDYYTYYLQEWDARRVFYPASPESRNTEKYVRFVQQHEDLTKSWRGNYMVCEKPDEEGALDDIPDSCCLAVWASKCYIESEMGEVEEYSNNFLTTHRKYRDKVYR